MATACWSTLEALQSATTVTGDIMHAVPAKYPQRYSSHSGTLLAGQEESGCV